MAEKKIRELGRFKGSNGGRVPIYGCESIEIGNKTNWDFSSCGVTSSAAAIWRGDDIATFNFSFELFAGLPPIPDRRSLYDAIKAMASWAQHQGEKGAILGPPGVRLIIPGYFNTMGVITECTMNAKAPWEVGKPYPTTCHFQGVFAVIPEYDGIAPKIASLDTKVSSSQIASKLFVLN